VDGAGSWLDHMGSLAGQASSPGRPMIRGNVVPRKGARKIRVINKLPTSGTPRTIRTYQSLTNTVSHRRRGVKLVAASRVNSILHSLISFVSITSRGSAPQSELARHSLGHVGRTGGVAPACRKARGGCTTFRAATVTASRYGRRRQRNISFASTCRPGSGASRRWTSQVLATLHSPPTGGVFLRCRPRGASRACSVGLRRTSWGAHEHGGPARLQRGT
jgi:hypothetical protein